jgi:hypothetical protein
MDAPRLENGQRRTSRRWLIAAIPLGLLTLLPFSSTGPIAGAWAVAFVGGFLTLCALIIALVFRSRAAKLDRLLGGGDLLLVWQLSAGERSLYAERALGEHRERNRALLTVMGVLFLLIGTPFLFFLESDERFIFVLILGTILLLLATVAFGLPWLTRRNTLARDGWVLIGHESALINGLFHNWDFPLSGLDRAELEERPGQLWFLLDYHYTTRTLRQVHQIALPLPQAMKQQALESISRLKGHG